MLSFRSYFSIPQLNGKEVVYFDSAATSLKLKEVITSLSDFYQNFNSNVHRSTNLLAAKATELFEKARSDIKNFLDPSNEGEVVFTRNTTESINLVASCFVASTLKDGDVILTSEAEHHSNFLPWITVAKRKRIKLEVIRVNLNKKEFLNSVLSSIEKLKPKLVALSHISNTTGIELPISEIGELIRKYNGFFLVDGAQATPHLRPNLSYVDFYAFSGHKVFGPFGVGILWFRRGLMNDLDPIYVGGGTVVDVSIDGFELAEPPYKFEAGTPPIAEVFALSRAITWLQNNLTGWQTQEKKLRDYFCNRLTLFDSRLKFINREPDAPIFTIHSDAIDITALNFKLSEAGICLRLGHHCTLPLHKALGIQQSLRISMAGYNTIEEIDYLIDNLDRIVNDKKAIHTTIFNFGEQLADLSDSELLEYLIDLSKEKPRPSVEFLKPENLVKGCMSKVYIWSIEDPPFFSGFSDTPTLNGLIRLLEKLLVNFSKDDILKYDFASFLDSVNLFKILTTNRRFGIMNLIDTIKAKISHASETGQRRDLQIS